MSVLNLSTNVINEQENFTHTDQKTLAWKDILDGLKQWRIWVQMAWQDISIRYRRSMLGPLWITLSMAIMVYSMGFLYAHLWHVKLENYFPYLVAGMVVWTFFSTLIVDSTDAYLFSGSLIRQIKLPYSLHIHRFCFKNVIIFFHNLLVLIPIYIIFYSKWTWSFSPIVFFIDLIIVYTNVFLFSNLIGLTCARYRDLGQAFKSLIQVLFFLTPVMWDIHVLPIKYQTWMSYNPLYNFIELLRAPLLGQLPTAHHYLIVGLCTLLGVFFNYLLFVPYRSRIVYWL